MLPNFLHVGAGKCASTWLWNVYKEHPDICVPLNSGNPSFFMQDYYKGLDWYQDTYFNHYAGEKVVGETSNSYMVFEPALERIANHLPGVKLTMTLRNPIERAFVQWVHGSYTRSLGPEQRLEFERALDPHGWVLFRYWMEVSMYGSHLKNVFRTFLRDRVLVMLYDDLVADPAGFIRRFFEFLEVDPDLEPSILHKLIGFPSPDRPDSDARIEKGMPEEVREELRQIFREDIEAVEEVTGRDLSHWR